MKFFNQTMITWILIRIAVRDWKEQRIPNADIAILFCFCALQLLAVSGQMEKGVFLYALFGACSASGILLLTVFLVPGAFGGGDIKLMAAAGILLGPVKSLHSLAAAIFLCGICILAGMAGGKIRRDSVIAFGPFLCAGILYHLWSTAILK
jgi:leader peptidase (prepilin peptidase)/N-methyltransferase|nr:A24 family peptidase [uncultured Faecalimonas sp.]